MLGTDLELDDTHALEGNVVATGQRVNERESACQRLWLIVNLLCAWVVLVMLRLIRVSPSFYD